MICVSLLCCFLTQGNTQDPAISPDAAKYLQLGAEAERRNDLDSAIAEFQKATDAAPEWSVAFLNLGDAYMRKHQYAEAIAPLKRAVELNPDLLAPHQLLGYALLTQGYAAEAIPHLERTHEYGALGIAQLEAGHFSAAVANLQAALDKTPDDPDMLFYLNRAASNLASQSLDVLLTKFPDSAHAHQALGQNHFVLRQFEQAEKEYQQAVALRPDLPGPRLELGQIYAANSEWQKAEEQFRLEARLQPGSGEAAYRLGDAFMQQGKMKDAIAELKRSDQLRPDMPETLYALGKAASAIEPAIAEQALLRVIELEKETPLCAKAYFALAGMHRKQGKTDQATREMQEFHKLQDQSNN